MLLAHTEVQETTNSSACNHIYFQGGHGNHRRFATLAGVHQGAHICLAKFGSKENFGARAGLRDVLHEN